MPIYEYDCDECHKTVELLIRGAEQPTCPHCHSRALTKRLSVPAAPATGRSAGLDFAPSSCNPSLPPCGPGCCRLPPE